MKEVFKEHFKICFLVVNKDNSLGKAFAGEST